MADNLCAFEKAWTSSVKKRLRTALGEEIFTSWFEGAQFAGYDGGVVTLSVSTKFLRTWIENHYNDQVQKVWREYNADILRIDWVVRGAIRARAVGGTVQQLRPSTSQNALPAPTSFGSGSQGDFRNPTGATVVGSATSSGAGRAGLTLDRRLSFDTFQVGVSNNLAHAAARQVADGNAHGDAIFNPLYIHAPVGAGKTHLMQAIVWQVQAQQSNARTARYLTASSFMHDFVSALQSQNAGRFKEELQNVDILLIDDLKFLRGDHILQEFSHLVNEMIDSGKQLVIASDVPPVELDSFDLRLRSRLAGGLVVGMGAPDYELRRSILLKKAECQKQIIKGLEIPDDVIDHVARTVATNGRDLESVLNKLIASFSFEKKTISIAVADQAVRDILKASEPRRIYIEEIQKAVSVHFKVSKQDLLSARRTRTIVRPRQIAMYLSKVLTPRSLPEIGRRFGGRDHTTVLHAVRKIEKELGTDNDLRREIEALKVVITG